MAGVPNVDLTPLTTAITKIAEDVVRTIARDTVPSLLTQQVEESLKKMVPGLVETAVSEEKVLIKETVQEVTRKALPDVLKPMGEQLAAEIIEKVARDVVGSKAEAEVKKEIERLTAEA